VAGALVSAVTPGGPAEKAGLEPGDTIVSFDDKDIESVKDLPRIVAETPVDKRVSVDIFREGKKMSIYVILGELEQAEQSGVLKSGPSVDEPTVIGSLGIALADINPNIIEKYNLDGDESGVIVVDVFEGSAAFDMNIREGHIIRRIGQLKVETVETVVSEVKRQLEADRSGVLMLIEADGRNRFIQLPFSGR